MIFDVFPFYNELDLLEIRLHELAGLVDKHILVESTVTFTGKPKPLHFAENAGRFTDFLSKIWVVTVRDMPATNNPWLREWHQRNAGLRGLTEVGAINTDLAISADLDEIPSKKAIKGALQEGRILTKIMRLEMRSYGIWLNAYSGQWQHATIGPVGQLVSVGPNQIRQSQHPVIPEAGWHFSSVGSPETISDKMNAFAHQEKEVQKWNNVEQIRERIARGEGLFGGKLNMHKLDESFPEHLFKNREKFASMIGPEPS